MSFEISFNKCKWFLVYVYKPPKISDECILNVLSKFADEFVGNSNVCVFFGDINCDMLNENVLCDLCDIYDMKNLVMGPTCFKGETPTLLDVFLTNKPNCFCQSINIDTGISDFHNLTGIVSRAYAPKSQKRMIKYRSMKKFKTEEYMRDMNFVPFHVCDIFDDVDDIVWAHGQLVTSVIDSHAPLKQRCVKNRQIPYMNSTLRKAIHQRNMWRNRHFRDKRNTTIREKYVYWRNKVVQLSKASVNGYFSKQCSGNTNGKQFFKIVKPFMNNKSNNNAGNKIMLRENNRIITDASDVAEIFNVFYSSISNYPANLYDGLDNTNISDIVAKHCRHESIVNIKSHMGDRASKFDFSKLSESAVIKMIKSLRCGKSAGYDGIRDTFLKMGGENLATSLCLLFNRCIDSCTFPTNMKMAEICPVYKKLDNLSKENYRSVNLLIVFSKLFERLMAEQLTNYFEDILSPLLSAYRKGYSCQHVILNLTEYWRRALDDNKCIGTIAMDLSRAFDCMPHGLLVAKLHAYGVSPKACIFISDYLKDRLQRVKLMGTHSSWTTINRGVPQGSVLGPLLFNIFLKDLFYLPLNSSLVNYADDNHICHENENLELLKDHIENDALTAMNWFNRNQTTANADKFQSILLSRGSTGDFIVNVGGHDLHRENTLKILGVTLDDKLNFKTHIRNICQKASRQINALKRISKFLNKQCRMHVYKSFVCANFNYCPVVWMFCGKTNLGKLERLQERALSTIPLDKSLSYDDLLKKSGQLSVRMNLIRLLSIEVFKCVKGTNPSYLNDMFTEPSSCYDFRNPSRLLQPKFNTYTFGYKSFRYFGSKVWNLLPSNLKRCDNIHAYRKELYEWCLTDEANKVLKILDL